MVEKDLTIRNAQDNERGFMREITVAAYAQYQTMMPPGFWTRYQHNLIATLDGEGNFGRIVAKQNGSLVGSVLLYPPAADSYASAAISTSYPEVRFLAVLPQMRGQGIGTALMRECERRARDSRAQAIGLHTMEVMRDAVRMYERLGYMRTPETDFRPGEGVVVLGYRHTL
jgi:ribosomal protein S18 acetylase RimI-like enzyme